MLGVGCGLGPQPWRDAGVPRPRGWPRRPQCWAARDPSLPLQVHLAQSRCIKDFGTFHSCIRHSLSRTERIFYNDLFLTLSCVFSLWTPDGHLDRPGSACHWGVGLPQRCSAPHLPGSSSWALGWARGSLGSLPRAHQGVHSAFSFPGALGQWLGLSPTYILGQAKASWLVTMQKLSREAPWAARWVLTEPPPSLACWP